MAKHLVKCLYCGITFDADKESYRTVGRRYAHTTCWEEHDSKIPQEQKDYEVLIQYLNNLFGSTPSPLIIKQIRDYKKDYNYSYTGIMKTLQWWYEIQKKPIADTNAGIAIVPYIYKEASAYYYNLYLAATLNEEIEIKSPESKIREITIIQPKANPKMVTLFDLGED